VASDGRTEVWARPLADGANAVALFSRGLAPRDVALRVPSHGALLVKVGV
jgi:hypothetical protein